jgi:hypothetical protein
MEYNPGLFRWDTGRSYAGVGWLEEWCIGVFPRIQTY